MKLLMASCVDENVMEYARYTLPILRMYAKRWDADFKILDNQSYNKLGGAMWNFRTMEFYELFEIYDRIFYMDSDIIINKTCPNIFDLVAYDTVGTVMEDKGSRLENRRRRIPLVKRTLGDNLHWEKDILNAGLYIVSRIHRNIFTKIKGKLYDGLGCDGNHYMYQIMRFGYKYIDLGYKWNHMSMFSESWNGSPSRFDSYILHYAGHGAFSDKGNRSRSQLIKDDIMRIYGCLEIEE